MCLKDLRVGRRLERMTLATLWLLTCQLTNTLQKKIKNLMQVRKKKGTLACLKCTKNFANSHVTHLIISVTELMYVRVFFI